jgi:hypothetical protein
MIGAQQPEPGFPTVPTQDPEALLAYAEATAAYARCLQRMAPKPGSKQPNDAEVPRSKSAQAAGPGSSSSLWTIIACLVIGAVGGVVCDRNMRAAADEDRPQLQQHEQKFSR